MMERKREELFEKFKKAYIEKWENGQKRGNPLFKRKLSERGIQRYYEEWIEENKKILEKLNYKEVLTVREFYEKYSETLMKKMIQEKPHTTEKVKEYFENLKKLNVFDELIEDLTKKYLNIKVKFIDPLVFILS